MQNELYSLVHGADTDGERSKSNARFASIDQLRSLQQENARLRILVAELLLENQTLRWKVAGGGPPEMPLASQNKQDA